MSCTCNCCYTSHKWSRDEDICRKHNIQMDFTGYSEFFNQNTYRCNKCDYENKVESAHRRRKMGRQARLEIKEKALKIGNLNGLYKEMYDYIDFTILIPEHVKFLNGIKKNK